MHELATQLQSIIEEVSIRIQQVDITEWDSKPKPEKWSKKEVIGHLIDSALNNIQRFVRGTYEDKFKLIYSQNEWVTAQRYQQADVNELIPLWQLLNKQIVRILRDYPPDRTEVLCDTGKQQPQFHTMHFLANDYIQHLQHHIKQLNLY